VVKVEHRIDFKSRKPGNQEKNVQDSWLPGFLLGVKKGTQKGRVTYNAPDLKA
jgi:hypothetical protein